MTSTTMIQNVSRKTFISSNPVDALIYIEVPAESEKDGDILNFLGEQSGVSKASYNRYIHKLVDVKFDPNKISCTSLVNAVKSQGYYSYVIAM